MSGIKIRPNFVVKTGGEQTLRIVTLDFLRQKGFDPTTGFGFTEVMSDRYGGKNLKLYKVFTDPDCIQGPGATRRLSFSADGKDNYNWNEYMTMEYWEAIAEERNAPVQAKEARKITPERKPVPPTRTPAPVAMAQPVAKKKGNNMMKMLILMCILNQQKAPVAAPVAKAETKKGKD